MARILLITLFFALMADLSFSAPVEAAVSLDKYTFDKVLAAHKAVLVKFDKIYNYGPKEEAFKKLAKRAFSQKDLLVATVGVSDYGEKENDDLRKRYNIDKSDFPVFKLFLKGQSEPIGFSGDVTVDGLSQFIKTNTGLWIGLPGCLEQFDGLAGAFISAEGQGRSDVLTLAEASLKAVENEADQKTANAYVKIMQKVIEKGDTYVEGEITRVNNLLKGKLSSEKKDSMQARLNILASFQPPKGSERDEL